MELVPVGNNRIKLAQPRSSWRTTWCSVSESGQRQKEVLGYLVAWLRVHIPHVPKEWFSTYEPFEGGTILMGHDTAYKTFGIGIIRMKMFDGRVWTLKGVRHAPNLRKNLLLGALETQRYKFTCMDGALKVTKGFMTVLKAEYRVNLYKVIRSVTIDDAFVSTKKDTTRLWHMRLGHMSERGLRALHNKGVLPDIKHYKLNLCKFCIMRRQSRLTFTISVHKTKGLLDLVHTDM